MSMIRPQVGLVQDFGTFPVPEGGDRVLLGNIDRAGLNLAVTSLVRSVYPEARIYKLDERFFRIQLKPGEHGFVGLATTETMAWRQALARVFGVHLLTCDRRAEAIGRVLLGELPGAARQLASMRGELTSPTTQDVVRLYFPMATAIDDIGGAIIVYSDTSWRQIIGAGADGPRAWINALSRIEAATMARDETIDNRNARLVDLT